MHGGRLTDVMLGGLNYQIEHHLFPSMPTPHLRRAQVIVRDYCAEIGVPYHSTKLIRSYRKALTHLHQAGGTDQAAAQGVVTPARGPSSRRGPGPQGSARLLPSAPRSPRRLQTPAVREVPAAASRRSAHCCVLLRARSWRRS